MRTRYKRLRDFGLTVEEANELRTWCRTCLPEERELIRKAADMANPQLSRWLYQSLVRGQSYDTMLAKEYIPIRREDFYAYQRATLAKLRTAKETKPGR